MSERSVSSGDLEFGRWDGCQSSKITVRARRNLLLRSATLVVLASTLAACSNGMARFDEATLLGTNAQSTTQPMPVQVQPNQVATYPQQQAVQQMAVAQPNPYALPPSVDGTTTASVVRQPLSARTLAPSPATAGALRPQRGVGARQLLPSAAPAAAATLAQTNDIYEGATTAPSPALPARFPATAAPAPVDPLATASVQPAPAVSRAPINPLRSARVALGNGANRIRSAGSSVLQRQPVQPAPTVKTGARLAPSQAPVQPFPQAPQQVAAVPQTLPPALPAAQPGTGIDTTVTGTPTGAAPRSWQGWSAAGGTAITARQGETVYNLSRRYGVPANAIIGVNNLGSGGLQAGQRVVIPTYQFNRQAGVSAPDANSNVQASSSALGWKNKLPQQVAPPRRAPDRMVVASVAAPRTLVPAQASTVQPLPPKPATSTRIAAPQPYTRPKAVAPTASGASYKVASGDTVSAIARRHGVSAKALMAHNGMSNPNIRVGQTLSIPTGGTAVLAGAPKPVRPVQTALAPREPKGGSADIVTGSTPSQGVDPIITGSTQATSPEASGISNLRWPVRGRVLANFGQMVDGKRNDGIDIAVPEGTSVKAAENGVVLYSGNELAGFGNLVLIKHEGGLVTAYAHNASLQVKRGQSVARGQTIARAGRTGDASTSKVHFEVRKNSTPVNPLTYLGG
ncbi:MAG: peptidoglycan DD-metalloendopeptidase family protein [Pseudomonadota bacterium]